MSSNLPRHMRFGHHSRPIAPALIFPGGAPFVTDLSHVPTEVKGGRAAHVAYLILRLAFTVDVVAAALAEAVTWRNGLARVLKNVTVRAAGHNFIENMDGQDLLTYSEALYGQADAFVPTGTILAAANATGTACELQLVIPFHTSPLCTIGNEDRLLPLALFRGSAGGQVTFEVNTTPLAGVTVTAVTSFSLTTGTIYRDRYMMPAPFEVRVSERAELYHVFQPKGALDMLALINRELTTAAARSCADYRLRSLTIGGEEVLLHPDQAPDTYEGGALAHRLGFGQNAAALSNAERFEIFMPEPFDRRVSKMVRGDVRLEFSARPASVTKERFLRVDTGIITDQWAEAYQAALGVPPGSGVFRTRADHDTMLAPLIAQEVAFQGSPAAIVASKAAR